MINVALLKKCKNCGGICKLEKIYIDYKTSEEEYLIKEYICVECGYKLIDREYINYIPYE